VSRIRGTIGGGGGGEQLCPSGNLESLNYRLNEQTENGSFYSSGEGPKRTSLLWSENVIVVEFKEKASSISAEVGWRSK